MPRRLSLPHLRLCCVLLLLLGLSLGPGPALAQPAAPAPLTAAYLTQARILPPPLSNMLPPPEDEGLAGARLGLKDAEAAGRFLKLAWSLEEVLLPPDADPAAAIRDLQARGIGFVILDLQGPALERALAGAPPQPGTLLINAGAADDRFRGALCRADLLHTLPSRQMLADALAQYLVKRRWTDWLLILGPEPADQELAAGFRRAAGRFGAEITAEIPWSAAGADLRDTAEQEVPILTQGPSYDVVLVADEALTFADLIPYRTWEARPVAGSAGLRPTGWSEIIEFWGAAQLQERFRALAGRGMGERDYAAWVAFAALSEAASRVKDRAPAALQARLRAEDFAISAFKGRKLSFRPWDGQLRQPIPLVTERSLVSMPPLDEFLHERTELDTLGSDLAETSCSLSP